MKKSGPSDVRCKPYATSLIIIDIDSFEPMLHTLHIIISTTFKYTLYIYLVPYAIRRTLVICDMCIQARIDDINMFT